MSSKPKLLTGIRPTADVLHVGVYLGAVKPTLDLQDTYQEFLCVVDLHAITTPYKPKELPKQITGVVTDWLAAGIDPKKNTLFIQSYVPAHVELMWLLNTITPVGELQRMTQYKDFKERFGEPQAGILNYPILMAADILLYKPEVVPVGDDQTQHIELTRDLAKKFNSNFGETFPIPKNAHTGIPPRIMSLNDPSKKMSKSLGPKSYIALSDDADTIRKKVMSAVTDVGPEGRTIDKKHLTSDKRSKVKGQRSKVDSMSPGVKNLFTLLELCAPAATISHMRKHYQKGKLQYAELKAVLANHLIEYLKPFQKRRKELEAKPEQVAKILTEGGERARKVANITLREVKEKMGLL